LKTPSPSEASPIRVRIAESRDLHEVMGINRKSFVLPYTVSVFREFYREHRYAFIVADLDGVIVGYSMSRVLKRLSFRGMGIKKIGHIMSIAVHPNYRRRGIGRMLLTKTMKILGKNGASELHLEVRVSNRLAREMYVKFGFREERRLAGYYSDGEDGILMVK
jgi:ribosomal-protein-alanine N-acetyltransferase